VGGRRGALGGAELRHVGRIARRVRALGLEPLDVATGQATAGAIYLVPLALLVDHPFSLPAPSMAVIASVFAIAAFCTALAYVVYFRILSGAGATNVLLVTLLAPATSVVLGALFLHERLLARQFLGFALIGVGLIFIDGRLPALSGANSNFTRRNPRLPTGQKSR
jgi:drug/metabolite transporter (DMT)-like permease